ncbi:MAG: hypothetical protein CMA77_02730 [Euryarchaeota archaeon]|nr:hypothetical protein [Euryarchaeota archaeon]
MASRVQRGAQRQLLDVLSSWKEPHSGTTLHESGALKAMQVGEDGSVQLRVKPARAHCPCCLLDFIDLRNLLLQKKKISSVLIEVVEVPDIHRWNSSINE